MLSLGRRSRFKSSSLGWKDSSRGHPIRFLFTCILHTKDHSRDSWYDFEIEAMDLVKEYLADLFSRYDIAGTPRAQGIRAGDALARELP